ncbi:MAG TPA: L,D-transpeptidase family protein [Puia sp.]|nr:L,D-transpeptidase family protein [Puia sp.]
MSYPKKPLLVILLSGLIFSLFYSCSNTKKGGNRDDASYEPGTMKERISDHLKKILAGATEHNNQVNDSVTLQYTTLTDSIYEENQFQPVWSTDQGLTTQGDSLFQFIENAKYYGLFPDDYHYPSLAFIRRVFQADSIGRKNASFWAQQDILLTDAFFTLVKHLKQGRLEYDSVTLRTDSVISNAFYREKLQSALKSLGMTDVFTPLEPHYPGYDSLKTYLRGFLGKATFKPYTRLEYPYRDSLLFFKKLDQRLRELAILTPEAPVADSATIAAALRKLQKEKGFKITGKLSDLLVDLLNDTEEEEFTRIAINLDRYKLLPDSLPGTRVWVNLPGYYLQVYNHDTLVFQSKIIVGGTQTRSPLLTSEISNFITYPQWNVPYSIIFKEMLPKIKQDVDYLNKENLMVVDMNDSVLDPHKINWRKMNKNHFPYQIKQKQGDDNSLGVIKFNFRNKYSVYMHDTNARQLFSKSFRALSHGCVRVKEWQKLANFLVRNDTVKYSPDTIRAWINRQEKHLVGGFPKLPIYIRYFTCEGKNGRIVFYDDIYGEDRYLQKKYFAGKTVQ